MRIRNVHPFYFYGHVLSAYVQISQEGEAGTAGEVGQVVFVGIGLALEGDVAVGVAGEEQPVTPFQQVKDVERYVPQFLHLGGMDQFMVQVHVCDLFLASLDEQHAEQVDGEEPSERYQSVVDYLHGVWRVKFMAAGDNATARRQLPRPRPHSMSPRSDAWVCEPCDRPRR